LAAVRINHCVAFGLTNIKKAAVNTANSSAVEVFLKGKRQFRTNKVPIGNLPTSIHKYSFEANKEISFHLCCEFYFSDDSNSCDATSTQDLPLHNAKRFNTRTLDTIFPFHLPKITLP